MQETLFGTWEIPEFIEPTPEDLEPVLTEEELRRIGQYTLFTSEIAEAA